MPELTAERDRTTRAPSAAPRSWHAVVIEHRLTVVYVAALVALAFTEGIPFEPATVVVVFASVLIVDVLSTSGLRRVGEVVRDWWPIAAMLVVYDLTRGVADTLGMPVHFDWMITADEWLAFGEVPTVWLQGRLLQQETQWWEIPAALVYLSHFVACFGLAAYLWRRSRPRWMAFMRRFLLLNAAGMVTYVLLPAAPPWLAAQEGLLPPVERSISRGWEAVGLNVASRIVEGGRATTNHVAAVPSLHAGYAFLFSFFLWKTSGRVARPLLAVYPAAMGFALVYSGEHYVIDILLGALYAGVVHLGLNARGNRSDSATPPSAPSRATVSA